MISIRKSVEDLSRVDELEKREALSKAILDCYTLAIRSTAHYAIEVDGALAIEFRTNLKEIEDLSRAAVSAEQVHSAQSSFRGELRDYHDKSNVQLQKLRKEMANASAAMTVFADSVSSNGENHEAEVSTQLLALQAAGQSNNIDEIRGGIGAAVAGIQSSVEQIQRENQLITAQLHDEIRMLHLQMEEERRALLTDRGSGAWNRQKIDAHLDKLLRQNQPFCLLLVWIRNLKRMESQHSRTVVEGTLKAIVSRLAAIAGDDAVIGRWAQDQFVAVLDMMPGAAIPLSADANRKLCGRYAVLENGLSQTVAVQATAGVLDRAANADASTFRQKLDQLAGAICGA